jgi:hypothetical protein
MAVKRAADLPQARHPVQAARAVAAVAAATDWLSVPANKELPDRPFPRRADFDYSSAAIYLVTICIKEKRALFGQIG